MIEAGDPLGEGDDFVATFQLENSSVRGRVTRLGDAVVDPILKRHDYPLWAGHVLGEALTLAVLISASLKFEGRITVQAEGDGPIRMLVAEARTDGGVRGYLRLNTEKWDRLMSLNKGDRPHVPQMIGKGVLGIVLIQDDPAMQPYQGVVPLDGATIAECAEHYFAQSEQIPTRVRLSVAREEASDGSVSWRAGGAILQQVAADDARGETGEDWNHARTLFDTVTDHELSDRDLSTAQLLFRLFHEDGVRLEPPSALRDACTCSQDRLKRTLLGLPPAEVRELAEDDGMLVADCQFCGRVYRFPADEVVGS